MPPTGPQSSSSLRDNRAHRGTVGEFLKSEIQPGSHLSFVSAYFTVRAYEALASQLEGAAKLRFLFGEPSFVTGIDRGDKGKANFKLAEHGNSAQWARSTIVNVDARSNAVRAVNGTMVIAYWIIGREIVQELLGRDDRAA